MAKALPNSRFKGYDYRESPIEWAQQAAAEAGANGNIEFVVAAGKDFSRDDYDLIACFDCLQDMGDPVGVTRRVREAIKPDGTFMIVEPFANDDLADTLNPVGRMYYSASTMICTPGSLAQEVRLGLGTQAGEARLTDVLKRRGSAASARRRRHRSTWCWKRGPDHPQSAPNEEGATSCEATPSSAGASRRAVAALSRGQWRRLVTIKGKGRPLAEPPFPSAGASRHPRNLVWKREAYLSSTVPPAASIWALILWASSLLTPSLIGFGAPSTNALASPRPS